MPDFIPGTTIPMDSATKVVADTQTSTKEETKEEPKERIVVPLDTEVPESSVPIPDEMTDFEKSVKLMEDARAGRQEADIPLSDSYWILANKHKLGHNK